MIEGWKNLLKNKYDFQVEGYQESIPNRRIELCNGCKYRKQTTNKLVRIAEFAFDVPNESCEKCGCNIYAKAFSLNSKCPMGFWTV